MTSPPGPGPSGESQPALDVLVVDDSAVVRQLLSMVLTEKGGMNVTTAADPLIAMRKMGAWR